jgi:streptogramin lyase
MIGRHPNIFTIFLIFLYTITNAQSIAIGQWREHLPYTSVISVAQGEDIIYAATPYSIFAYNKADNSIQRLNKINGLSDHSISTIGYHPSYKALFVAYNNTNLDIIINNKITNVPDIKNKAMSGKKQINKIRFFGHAAYLCGSFGVASFDMIRMEFKDTYIISSSGDISDVYDFEADESFYYAATSDGVYRAPRTALNLADFQSWQKILHNDNASCMFQNLAIFNNKLYANKHHLTALDKDTLFFFGLNGWEMFDSSNTTMIKNMNGYDSILIVAHNYFVYGYDLNRQLIRKVWTYNPGSLEASDAIFDEDDNIWIADLKKGLVRNYNEWGSELIAPNGPNDAASYAMDFYNGQLWVSTGGMDDSWNNLYLRKGVYHFGDEKWNSLTGEEVPKLDTVFDILTVAVDPTNSNRAYFGTWGSGLLEFTGGELTNIYNETNSSLRSISSIPGYYWLGVYGITFDASGNMWVVNASATQILSVRKTDGTWKSFGFGYAGSNIRAGNIVIDKSGQKWIVLPRGQGLIVFNDGGTIDNTNDDKYKILSNVEGNGKLPSLNISAIAADLDGKIWVGTDKGMAVFYAPENVFTNYNFDAEQILVDMDGNAQHLFETEVITDIKVDGANRKWVSTQNAGVFLVSANGTEEVYHFNKDNSPLYSDNVTCMAIDGKSGEVYFGTDKGIISYRSTATTGEKEFENVVVFPNPIRPNYNGPIAIKGLVSNVDIKITDINGNLVYASRSEGGQAIWDGKNVYGERVNTGVYLVFCTNDDGSKKHVAKILFIN